MIKGKKIFALIMALCMLVFCSMTDIARGRGMREAGAAAGTDDGKTDFSIQEFRLQTGDDSEATTGTGRFNRVGEKQVYLAVRTSKDFKASDFAGTFYFYWTDTSGNRNRDTSVLLGQAKAITYLQSATDFPNFKGNWKIGDDVPVIICKTIIDTSAYEVGDRLYMWVYYDSEGKGTMKSKASSNERQIIIEASTVVTMNPIASVEQGDDAVVSAKVTSSYGVEEGTLRFFIGDRQIGQTDVMLNDVTTDKGTQIKEGAGTINVPTDDMDIATHKVYAVFEPKESAFPVSKNSKEVNLTVTATEDRNEAPQITDKQFDDKVSRDPVNVTFKVTDDKDIRNLVIEVTSRDGSPVEYTKNGDEDTISFTVTENGKYNITVTDENGAQAIDDVLIENIREDKVPNIDDAVRDISTPGKVILTVDVDDDFTVFDDLVIKVTDADGAEVIPSRTVNPDDQYDGKISFPVTKSGTITIKATDDRNQTKTQTLEINVPNLPPVIGLKHRDTATAVQESATQGFTISDDITPAADLTIVIKDSKGAPVTDITRGDSGDCSFTVTENDTYTITVTDAQGAEAFVDVVIDNINKKPQISVADRNDKVSVQESDTLEFTVSDDRTPARDLKVEIKDSKGNKKADITPDNDGKCSCVITENETYTVTVTDGDGGVSVSDPITVTNINRKPTLNIKPWDTSQTSDPVRVDFTVNDDRTPIRDLVVEVRDADGKPVNDVIRSDNGSCSFEVKENGTYIVTVKDTEGGVISGNQIEIANIVPKQEESTEDTSQESAEAPTEKPTEKPTEAPTQESTEKPTEAASSKPGEPANASSQAFAEESVQQIKGDNPQTGDGMHAGLYAAVCLIAASVAGCGIFKRRKLSK